jgi:hypothetical protein
LSLISRKRKSTASSGQTPPELGGGARALRLGRIDRSLIGLSWETL